MTSEATISKDPINYKEVNKGDLLYSDLFGGGYATCLDKRMEWELTPVSNDHFSWELIQVADLYGEVYWVELHKAQGIYKVFYPTTPLPASASKNKKLSTTPLPRDESKSTKASKHKAHKRAKRAK
jgi:hypothetical protein